MASGITLGYLEESNAAAHSIDIDVFYAVIHLPGYSETYFNLRARSIDPIPE